MKVTLVEYQKTLCCIEFAQVGRKPPTGVCPSKHVQQVRELKVVDNWADGDIYAWVAACPDITPDGPHDHRFVFRYAIEGMSVLSPSGKFSASPKGQGAMIAMSHYEGRLHRTKHPAKFTAVDCQEPL